MYIITNYYFISLIKVMVPKNHNNMQYLVFLDQFRVVIIIILTNTINVVKIIIMGVVNQVILMVIIVDIGNYWDSNLFNLNRQFILPNPKNIISLEVIINSFEGKDYDFTIMLDINQVVDIDQMVAISIIELVLYMDITILITAIINLKNVIFILIIDIIDDQVVIIEVINYFTLDYIYYFRSIINSNNYKINLTSLNIPAG